MNKKPHGDGVYFDEIGNKFVGEWKNGFAWNVKLYGTGGGLGGVYVKGKNLEESGNSLLRQKEWLFKGQKIIKIEVVSY